MPITKYTADLMGQALLRLAGLDHKSCRDRFMRELVLYNMGGLVELDRYLLERVRERVDEKTRYSIDFRGIRAVNELVILKQKNLVAWGPRSIGEVKRALRRIGLRLGMSQLQYEKLREQELGQWLSTM